MRSTRRARVAQGTGALLLLLLAEAISASEPVVAVGVLNYVRARTALHFDSVMTGAGGVNRWKHTRVPIPLDQQRSKRMNRDTLYSSAVIDISAGATLTMPDAGERYMSATVINEDHFINRIFHGPGEHRLTVDEFDTPWVLLTVRTLADESDPEDMAAAVALQDALTIDSASAQAFVHANYDRESLDATTLPLMQLAAGLPDVVDTFGRREVVDPVRHLLASAYGWGGLPETEVVYLNVQPELPVGAYALTVRDVPVNGFWSISVYNAEGLFEYNVYDAYSVNDLTAERGPNGTVTVHFGGDPESANFLPIGEGWNYVVRMYRPRAEVADGSWSFPEVKALP